MIGPLTETEPASAKPKPSRMVFLPSSITFTGIFSYFVFTIKSLTYFVRPGDFGNTADSHGGTAAEAGASNSERAGKAAAAASKLFLKNWRRIMFYLRSLVFQHCGKWGRLSGR